MANEDKRVTQIGFRPLFLSNDKAAKPKDFEAREAVARPIPKRKFPASTDRTSFSTRQYVEGPASPGTRPPGDLVSDSKQRAKRLRTDQVFYNEFMELDQAGHAVIAGSNTPECTLVAIKWGKGGPRPLPDLEIPCDNIVKLLSFTANEGDGDRVRMIYELMDVSLRVINSIPKRKWSAHEIAAICKEVRLSRSSIAVLLMRGQVLAGLAFIHDSGYHYDGVHCGKIMLDRSGSIKLGLACPHVNLMTLLIGKIANFGDCILSNSRRTKESERQDVQSIGYMMVELMETATYIHNPKSITLRHPEQWVKTNIEAFLKATQGTSRSELSKVRIHI